MLTSETVQNIEQVSKKKVTDRKLLPTIIKVENFLYFLQISVITFLNDLFLELFSTNISCQGREF
jgi:hypothetical protein